LVRVGSFAPQAGDDGREHELEVLVADGTAITSSGLAAVTQ
jgi:hypothetical protein